MAAPGAAPEGCATLRCMDGDPALAAPRYPLGRRFRARRPVVLASILALFALALGPATSLDVESAGVERKPVHHLRRGFRNLDEGYRYGVGVRMRHFVRSSFQAQPTRGAAPAVLGNDGAALRANGTHPTVTWVGHSTFLVQLDGVNILTDPHWGDRASPVDFAGPRRLVPPGLAFEALPPIDAVLISHDHYDHLDADTVGRLAREHRPRFFVPLGLRAWLAERGITDVVELDWWDRVEFRGLTVVCTPAQHSSGRTLTDQYLRLWSSWAVLGQTKRVFFAGDTGYDPRFKSIGDRFGPFDLAMMPIGGYSSFGRAPEPREPRRGGTALRGCSGPPAGAHARARSR